MGIRNLFKKKDSQTSKGRYSCANCGITWDEEKMEMLYGGFGNVTAIVSRGSNQYAGKCTNCKKLYCGRCALFTGISIQCPECKIPLKASLKS